MDEILVSTINAAPTAPPSPPPELAGELAGMHLLSDDALRAAVQPSLSRTEQHRLRQLNHTAGERPLAQADVWLNEIYRSKPVIAQVSVVSGPCHPGTAWASVSPITDEQAPTSQ